MLIVTIRRDEFRPDHRLPLVLQPGDRFSYGDNNVEAVVISVVDKRVTFMLASEPIFERSISDREIASSKILEQYGTSVAPEEIVDISEQECYKVGYSRDYYSTATTSPTTWKVTTSDETFVVSF